MQMTQMFLKELDQEALTTRKMLERVPNDRYDWQPHPKSMTIRQLATHVAELPNWITMALNTTELDFATSPYTPAPIADTAELMAYFEKSLTAGRASLAAASEDDLLPDWTLRSGEKIHIVKSKAEVIRMTFSQIVHHRAQLGVDLRLLNIPIPGSYGPSADEMSL
jgi:uncharacterized damage-inducible protein DinB